MQKSPLTVPKLRHDHGSNYMSHDLQEEIAFLGVESSPSFVREPEGNGVAERRSRPSSRLKLSPPYSPFFTSNSPISSPRSATDSKRHRASSERRKMEASR